MTRGIAIAESENIRKMRFSCGFLAGRTKINPGSHSGCRGIESGIAVLMGRTAEKRAAAKAM
jgi:hypothetical protein